MDPANGECTIDMKRRWNLSLWLGFVVVLGGLFSYVYFAQFPITRDFPWLNLLLIGVGLALLATGLFRAFGNPRLYRGKIAGSILAVISVCVGRVLLLRDFLRPARRAGFARSAAHRRKSARVYVA